MKIIKINIFRRKSHQRRGFIAMLALILLIIFGILGTSYWLSSRATTGMIVREAHRVKARSYAQAGIETVKMNIANQYSSGNHNLEYPTTNYVKGRIDKEYNMKFSDGEYKIIKVEPYSNDNYTYSNALHYINGVVVGHYDIWEITSQGTVYASKVSVRVKTLVKVYRDYVSY